MKNIIRIVLAVVGCCSLLQAQVLQEARIVSSQKIWDAAPYNAFTDLIYWHDQFYCVFREASSHLSFDGTLRLLSSPDGTNWSTAAVIHPQADDLREGHLSVTPDDKLLIVSAIRSKSPIQSVFTQSNDGKTFPQPAPFGQAGTWVWRLRWNDKTGYGLGYHGRKPAGVDLYTTTDVEHFECTVPNITSGGNESDILFRSDGSAVVLVRRDATKDNPDKNALMGIAKPPYRQWDWQDTGTPIGSPALLELPDHRILAAVRLLDNQPRTSLCWLGPTTAKLTELLMLPPAGDKPGNVAYPGMIWHDGSLYVSYYAPENGKCCIYFAKIALNLTK